jgi:hypothetical protein
MEMGMFYSCDLLVFSVILFCSIFSFFSCILKRIIGCKPNLNKSTNSKLKRTYITWKVRIFFICNLLVFFELFDYSEEHHVIDSPFS